MRKYVPGRELLAFTLLPVWRMAPLKTAEIDKTVERLLRQQAALAKFGSFAFKEPDRLTILTEAARICAASLGVPFCKICRYRPAENDLLIEAGCGWNAGVIGRVVSRCDETSPQGRAYVTPSR